MLEELAKNVWLLLTLVIPGLFTYGAWRAILLLEPSRHLASEALSRIDSSVLVTTSIIVAVALLQQAVAIVIEAALALIAWTMRKQCPNFHALFCDRFSLAAAGKLNETATRIIGNLFLSTDMCIGLGFMLIYFLAYESMKVTHWVPVGLMVLLGATFASTVFRLVNAEWAVKECKKEHHDKK